MAKAARQSASAVATEPREEVQTSIVVPVYNERDNLPQLMHEIRETMGSDALRTWRPYEVLFVEDGSTDGTSEYIDSLAAENERVTAVHLRRNWGQSAALAAGLERASGEVVITMDGDLQNDPADIPWLLRELADGADCVSGWRKERDDPWHKTVPSAIQTRLAKLTGPDINDFGCTLTAYRAEALEAIDLRGETHRYIPAQLYDKGYDVTEVEVNHRPREHGESRYGVGRLLRGFVDLVFHWFWVWYGSRPMHLLGGAGFLSIALGAGIGAISVLQRFLFGVPLDPRTPRLILVGLLISVGLQLVVFGFLAEILAKEYHRDDPEYRIERIET